MMKNMTLENIAKACNGEYHGPDLKRQETVRGITIDSRKTEPGWLFVATRGERADGHTFVSQVMEKGALCVLVEKVPDIECPYILVRDSFQALKDIAAFYRSVLSCKVIGITGSVGKTSTKEMIAGVLAAKYRVLKTDGNFNNEVGVPLTLFRIRDEHEVAVVEMGISDFGEMSRLTAMVKPDICVITNIGECHLENLGDRDGVLKAKTEIFEGMSGEGEIVLNGQDDKLVTIREVRGKKPHFFAAEECYAENIVSKGLLGTECVICRENMKIKADIRVQGVHQVKNAMAAVCVAQLLGLTVDEIETGIRSVTALPGRGKIIEGGRFTLIDETYNANPVSMKATLDALAQTKGRRVAVLGDMFELGMDSDALHAGVGSYAKEKGIDVLICIGENAHYIYEGAQAERVPVSAENQVKLLSFYFRTKEEFLAKKEEILHTGDIILIKASHGMHFETLKEELV